MENPVELKVGDLVRVVECRGHGGVVVALGGADGMVHVVCYDGQVVTCHPLRCQLLAKGSS
jgi:hypothetical protein